MKKNLLLVIMFVMMFFVGSNDVYAEVRCSVDQNGDCLNKVLKHIENLDSKLICLYEVSLNKPKSSDNALDDDVISSDELNYPVYYNYIYYGRDAANSKIGLYAGTTYGQISETKDNLLEQDSSPYIVGGAIETLYKNNQCPAKSYISYSFNDKICFDDEDGECYSLDNNWSIEFKYNTYKSDFVKKYDNSEQLIYKDLTLDNACKMTNNDLPEGYKEICTYIDYETGRSLYLLYNNSGNTVVYDEADTGNKVIVKNGEQSNKILIDRNSAISEYAVYKNEISTNINSCPNSIYLVYERTSDSSDIYHNYSFSSSYPSSVTSVKKYSQFDCKDNSFDISDNTNCDDLINGELREYINSLLTIIRIGVPILLIGLLTYDVAQAVFAGDDKKISDLKNKAIKRIIIAIVIFFVPVFVNVIFDLVNEVWNTNFETCGLDD